jgi:site-specific DNA-methyltransferase (adenine-specific)
VRPYYEQDGITIYHGDCRAVLPALDDGLADVTITDAPFNTAHDTGGSVISYGNGTDESRPWVDYVDWLLGIVTECERVTTGPVLCFVSKRGLFHMIGRRHPWWLGQWVNSGTGSPSGPKTGVMFQPSYEPCLFYGNRYSVKTCMSDAWQYPVETVRLGHPCPKPVSLMRRLIRDLQGQTILDPFMGSGTTLRAAKDLQRRAIGIEIEERYCEIAANRLAQGVLFAA